MQKKLGAQVARIEAVVGNSDDSNFEECLRRFYEHLIKSLRMPCDVTGIEDFRWEEYYVIGVGDPKEYELLKNDKPSYQDIYELQSIEKDAFSEWMLFEGDDLGALVRRKSDGKEFYLGLAELKAVDKKSKTYQILDDFSVWFVNSR